MSRYWSPVVHSLRPYVPGEQPAMGTVVKLNTNENPYGPSPRVIAALSAEIGDGLRLYPDPGATRLRDALAARHGLEREEIFVGNGSDEVLAHSFQALLRHDAPLLFPDITYSFYPTYCRLYGVDYREVPLDGAMRIQRRRLSAGLWRDHPAQSERAHRHCASARGGGGAGRGTSGSGRRPRRGLR